MDSSRKANGQFGAGNRANPRGRPRKTKSMIDEVARELQAKVTITENGKRRRVSKLAANAKQVANQGASGELKAAKMTMDFAMRAEREREAPPEGRALSQNDREIVERFIARLMLTDSPAPAADPVNRELSEAAPSATDLPSSENPAASDEENPNANA